MEDSGAVRAGQPCCQIMQAEGYAEEEAEATLDGDVTADGLHQQPADE